MTDLRPLRAFSGEAAEWAETDREEYALRGDGDLFATLRLGDDQAATAAALEGSWTFAAQGRGKISWASIRDEASGTEIGTCRLRHLQDALLTLHSGYTFKFLPANAVMTAWTWQSADGRDILTLDRGINRATVRLLLASDRYRDLSLLACFGWYLAKTWWT